MIPSSLPEWILYLGILFLGFVIYWLGVDLFGGRKSNGQKAILLFVGLFFAIGAFLTGYLAYIENSVSFNSVLLFGCCTVFIALGSYCIWIAVFGTPKEIKKLFSSITRGL